jgi:isopentenyldiphosphate isomerase
MTTPEEQFELVDTRGDVVGLAPRRLCHGNPALRHRAVHVLVFDGLGRLFLQKRSARKDTAPGLWDTSVGGHMQPGEQPEEAAGREFQEELGVPPGTLTPAYRYEWSTAYETELIIAFATRHEGPFFLQVEEIDEGRFWTTDEISAHLGRGLFTPQFEQEYPRMLTWWNEHHAALSPTSS